MAFPFLRGQFLDPPVALTVLRKDIPVECQLQHGSVERPQVCFLVQDLRDQIAQVLVGELPQERERYPFWDRVLCRGPS